MSTGKFSLFGRNDTGSRIRRADRLIEQGDPSGAFELLARSAEAGVLSETAPMGAIWLEKGGLDQSMSGFKSDVSAGRFCREQGTPNRPDLSRASS